MESKQYPILEKINSPSDLKKLDESELPQLCSEIRSFLTENVLKTGGHLASNLGVVELTVAIHRIFNAPEDTVIWDVGHQSYVHKILTGRRDSFHTLRQPGGLSGFTRRAESEYDPFGAGHSSTSISAAMGIARAKKLSGDPSFTVAVLGDGAFTGGLIHEALNNADKHLRLILILNENEMSISRNIGGFANHLQKLRQSRRYHRTKRVTRSILSRIPLIGKPLFHLMRATKQMIKNAIYNSNYFEDLGMYYLGPVDGHNLDTLEGMLEEAKKTGQSTVLHVKTVKGKGFSPAEDQPNLYHGVNPQNKPPIYNYSAEMGKILCEMAEKDDKILAITAAMAEGCGLCGFADIFPDRFFDVGIAEEHALVFAAGLAVGGYRPVFAVYSTFLQRGYDNLIHDIALQNLPVTVCIDRASLSAGDGPTHHGIFDVAFLNEIPGVTVYAPFDFASLRECMERGIGADHAVFIRYPNGSGENRLRKILPYGDFGVRSCFTQSHPADAILITYGRLAEETVKAAELLYKEGIICGIVLLEQLSPIQPAADALLELLEGRDAGVPILFAEEGIRRGGEAMILLDAIRDDRRMKDRTYRILAIDDPFRLPEAGQTVLQCHGLSAEQIADAVRESV
ncbi:MAG: 1-deoxy-D-xylulose-5-phosphate synthase [Eubacteriales bacterium]